MKSLSLLLAAPGRPGVLLRCLPLRPATGRNPNVSCNHILQRRSLSFGNESRVIALKGQLWDRNLRSCDGSPPHSLRRMSTSAQEASVPGAKVKAGNREFDIVIFGATGLAGRYCIEQLHKSSDDNIRWAVAGRNRSKLSKSLREVSSWVGSDLSNINIIEADFTEPGSLSDMAKRTRCILNTVGSYTTSGEPVIKACLAEGTHMLDLSGELHFNEAMRNKYHQRAKEREVIFVSTCGFGSVVGELLLLYAKDNFTGQLNTLQTYSTFHEGAHGSVGNLGTLKSIMEISQNITKMQKIRKEAWGTVFKQPWQPVTYRKKLWLSLDRRKEVPGYSLPLLGMDKPVMNHSEFFRRELNPKYERTQIQNRLYDKSYIRIARFFYAPAVIGLLSQFSISRKLLLKQAPLFSLGLFREGGPSREQTLTCSFSTIGIGEGWLDGEPRNIEPTHQIIVRVDGPEVGYVTTSTCLVQSAICLLKETDRVPLKGGYLTPGFALGNTSLQERLCQRGFDFNVVGMF